MHENKYTVPFDNRSKVRYEIPCKDCPEIYEGETKQKMYHRRGQHKRDVKNKKMIDGTTLSQHATANNHEIVFEKIKIANYMPGYWPRRTVEYLQVMKHPTLMNKKDTAKRTHLNIYSNILNHHPNK